MSDRLRRLIETMPTADDDAGAAVRERAAQVLRPLGALHRLDEIAVHCARWQRTARPSVERPAVLVFAADHGVAAAGVSAYPSDVTAAMIAAVRAGQATITAMARVVGASLDVFDVGVGDPTDDIRVASALSPDRFDRTVEVAVTAVDAAARSGADMVVLGELGIGNTTVSAAIAAALLGGDTRSWVGRGTGVDDDGWRRKCAAVDQAVARVVDVDDPIEIMREVGGAELVAMAAACVAARHHRLPVMLDGYVCTAAVLPLHIAAPGAIDHCLAGHLSAEPGHRRMLDRLGLDPLLQLDMRLGEGSGALAAVPLAQMACAGVVDVPTFAEWFGE
jgi:nicotinate-nucleotide--dimethylbenzimidazole phosphoribosyltransferase